MNFAHLDTIIPSFFRPSKKLNYERMRISTLDDDFLDLDFLRNGSETVSILCHGLESSSKSPYIKNMANALYKCGDDVVAWNNRSCSEEMNRTTKFYHSGDTSDLKCVVEYCLFELGYKSINLIGFSMGGNQVLCFLACEKSLSEKYIKKSIVFSVPMDLSKSSLLLNKGMGRVYGYNFLKTLKPKVLKKTHLLKQKGIEINNLKKVRTLGDFDHYFTAPISGFESGEDYYAKCSSLGLLEEIRTPVKIVNALNDPFLSGSCYPQKIKNNFIRTYYPKRGGHIGFWQPLKKKNMEILALDYLF